MAVGPVVAPAEGFADGLMAETYAEQGHILFASGADQVEADSGMGGVTGARGNHDPGGVDFQGIVNA